MIVTICYSFSKISIDWPSITIKQIFDLSSTQSSNRISVMTILIEVSYFLCISYSKTGCCPLPFILNLSDL